MAQFIIRGIVGSDRLYYTDNSSSNWSNSIKNAHFFKTKHDAEEALMSIVNEQEEPVDLEGRNGTRFTIFYAPDRMRELARLKSDDINATVKIQVCAVSLCAIDTERWHVEDGFGKTKRLS